MIKLQHIFGLLHNDSYSFELRAVKRIESGEEGHAFLKSLEATNKESNKYVMLECGSDLGREVITKHVADIYMGRRNYHFFFTNLVMDDFWGQKITEFGAVVISNF